jgi:hypothetical protein
MSRSLCLFLSGLASAWLGACNPPDYSDTSCSGYLGCSAGVKIGPPDIPMSENGADAGRAPEGVPAVGINAVSRGAGCGKAPPVGAPATFPGTPKGYMHYTVMGTGETLAGNIPAKRWPRTFWVRIPANYDPDRAYRVVYIGQGCGGFQAANTSTLPLFKEGMGGSEQAIYVALDIPEDMANMDCYDNRDGLASQEWEAFELFHTVVDENYCVDNNRIFVSGYSTGGWLSNMWGCYFAGDPATPRKFAPKYHIRGQAAVTGGEPAMQPACGGPVAAIWIHDTTDKSNDISGSYQACKRVLKMNGCVNTSTCEDVAAKTTPWHHEIPMLDVCQQFDGCPRDYPVVFCKTQGLGHMDQAPRATAAFNAFFNMLNPLPP